MLFARRRKQLLDRIVNWDHVAEDVVSSLFGELERPDGETDEDYTELLCSAASLDDDAGEQHHGTYNVTPLCLACKLGVEPVVVLLLSKISALSSAETRQRALNTPDRDGWTPVMWLLHGMQEHAQGGHGGSRSGIGSGGRSSGCAGVVYPPYLRLLKRILEFPDLDLCGFEVPCTTKAADAEAPETALHQAVFYHSMANANQGEEKPASSYFFDLFLQKPRTDQKQASPAAAAAASKGETSAGASRPSLRRSLSRGLSRARTTRRTSAPSTGVVAAPPDSTLSEVGQEESNPLRTTSLAKALNALDSSGNTPLTLAIRQRAVLAAVRCADNSSALAPEEQGDESPDDPLLRIIAELSSYPGFDPNTLNSEGNPALSVAIVQGGLGRERVVAALLNHPLLDLDRPGKGGMTPFFSALQLGNQAVVHQFVRVLEERRRNGGPSSCGSSNGGGMSKKSSSGGGATSGTTSTGGLKSAVGSKIGASLLRGRKKDVGGAGAGAAASEKTGVVKVMEAGTHDDGHSHLEVTDAHIRLFCAKLGAHRETGGGVDARDGTFLRKLMTEDLLAGARKSLSKRAFHFFVEEVFNRAAFQSAESRDSDVLCGLIRTRWGDFYESRDTGSMFLPGNTGFFSSLATLADFHYGYSDSTVLHVAVTRNSPENRTMFKALLRHDLALPMLLARDKNGCQPLHIACEFLKVELLADFLLGLREAHASAVEAEGERRAEEKTFAEEKATEVAERSRTGVPKTAASSKEAVVADSARPSTITPLSVILNAQDNMGGTPLMYCLKANSATENVEALFKFFGPEIRRSLTLFAQPKLSPYLFVRLKFTGRKKETLLKLLAPCACEKTTVGRIAEVIGACTTSEEKDASSTTASSSEEHSSDVVSISSPSSKEKDDHDHTTKTSGAGSCSSAGTAAAPDLSSSPSHYHAVANEFFDGFYDLIHEVSEWSPTNDQEDNSCTNLVAKKSASLLLWEHGIAPLLDLCGRQLCLGPKKDLLQRLLQQSRGASRDFYRDSFTKKVEGNFSLLTDSLAELQQELVAVAEERVKPGDAVHFCFSSSAEDEFTLEGCGVENARQACLELLYGIPPEQYFDVPVGANSSVVASASSRRAERGSLTARLTGRGNKAAPKTPGSKTNSGSCAGAENAGPGLGAAAASVQRLDNFCAACLNVPVRRDHNLSTAEAYQLLVHDLKIASDARELIDFYRVASKNDACFREDPAGKLYGAILAHFSAQADEAFSQAVRKKLVVDGTTAPSSSALPSSSSGAMSFSGAGPPSAVPPAPFLRPNQFKRAPVKKLPRILVKGAEYQLEHDSSSSDMIKAAGREDLHRDGFGGVQHVLDTFRCSFTLENPQELVRAVRILKAFSLKNDGLQLYRLKNMHSRKILHEQTSGGYRDVKANVVFTLPKKPGGGPDAAAGTTLRMVGEVILILRPVMELKKHMHLLYKCQRGDF